MVVGTTKLMRRLMDVAMNPAIHAIRFTDDGKSLIVDPDAPDILPAIEMLIPLKKTLHESIRECRKNVLRRYKFVGHRNKVYTHPYFYVGSTRLAEMKPYRTPTKAPRNNAPKRTKRTTETFKTGDKVWWHNLNGSRHAFGYVLQPGEETCVLLVGYDRVNMVEFQDGSRRWDVMPNWRLWLQPIYVPSAKLSICKDLYFPERSLSTTTRV